MSPVTGGRKIRIRPLLFAAALMLWLPAGLQAQYNGQLSDESAPAENSAESARPDTGGLQFSVPDDWPIEKRNGAVGPIPIEEYMKLRFDRVETQMNALDARVQQLEENIAQRDKEENARRARFISAESEPETEKENS